MCMNENILYKFTFSIITNNRNFLIVCPLKKRALKCIDACQIFSELKKN